MPKGRTIAILLEEGTVWIPFERLRGKWGSKYSHVHAIKFEDGSIWDAYNGWRSGEDNPAPNEAELEELIADVRMRMSVVDTSLGVLHAFDKCAHEAIFAARKKGRQK